MAGAKPERASSGAQGTLFDYSVLDVETRIVVQQRTGEIKSLVKRVARDIVEIGGKLAEVKDRLGRNDRFTAWLEAELKWAERTAYNFITVWQKFKDADFALENIATSAIYLLAAPSTPDVAVDAVRKIAQEGGEITHSIAKAIVAEAKESEKAATPMLFPTLARTDEAEPDHIEVRISQQQLEAMDAVNACEKIVQGEPVRLYEYEGASYLVTGSTSFAEQGVFWVMAWPVVPEGEAKGIAAPEQREKDTQIYIGMRVNAGTKKRPDWWVVKGPAHEFTIDEKTKPQAAPAKVDPRAKEILETWQRSTVRLSLQYLPAGRSGHKVVVTMQANSLPATSVTKLLREDEVNMLGPLLELLEEFKRDLPAKLVEQKQLAARKSSPPARPQPAGKRNHRTRR